MSESTHYREILFEVDDPVATITLNRPEALNAWTDTMAAEVRDAVGRAAGDPAVVGLVLTGAGKGFCAGADMKRLSSLSSGAPTEGAEAPFAAEPTSAPAPGEASWGDDLRGTYTYFMSVPKPIIAAINGPVAGMGVPIALSCDLRFMSATTVLTTSFAQRGLVAEWGLSWLLGRLVGPAHALDVLFSARRVDGEEAARMGLVNRALPTEEVLPAAQQYIRDLAATSSPASMAVMKRQVYTELHAGLGAAERHAIQLMVESFGRPDFKEGVSSFLDRRPPKFGRLGA
ncbi:MAG: enoyl-CoA hydratase-related protein [Ilumatobacteraceae bacterium]